MKRFLALLALGAILFCTAKLVHAHQTHNTNDMPSWCGYTLLAVALVVVWPHMQKEDQELF